MNPLLVANQRGIFPAPGEEMDAFLLRASSLPKKNDLSSLTNKNFDAEPDWLEVKYGGKGLMPWEGACTWIGDGQVSIQVKQSLITRLYAKDEVLAHEMVHGMRHALDSQRFEEILAYRTSSNRFRRYFGPLFSHPAESKIFAGAMALSWIAYGFWGEAAVLCAPLIWLCWGLTRLVRSQRIFSQVLKKLDELAPGKGLAIALRLTDEEIAWCAGKSIEEIRAFASIQTCARWQQIQASYLSSSSLCSLCL